MNMMMRHALPMLEIDVLKTFVAIAETGNFTTAAEAVYRTPSAVSMQIKKMEELLGCALFLRDARSVSLTPKGEVLLGFARRMLALNNEAVTRFLMPDMHGVVRLGAPEDLGERILPDVLKRFGETFPNVTVDVTIGQSNVMRKRVEERRMDIVIYNSFPSETLRDGEILMEERLVWAGTRCGTAHLREPLPVSMWEDGCVWRADAIDKLNKSGRAHRVAFLSAHTTGQKAAILADLAIAPLPRYLVQGDLVELGPAEGLPDLGTYNIGIQTIDDASAPVLAVAEHVRAACIALV
ncbi:DNA-binding transcriptional LysR family regulator [Rhizobium sp. PP-F2F-G38]|uniref:LysR family transcriptional regulator n=1 Tax=Rhizobium sp. PP-CC-3G-465 TaxID=2135648 RepID=UPI000D8943CE|nr:DNA-binding transcriptional LysR family regulator [Rhizobium sp. PP-WC-1G-195]PYF00723.1 DNA-binding transcriptional LysR family regulator [Rhizobium sp. PP-F2F-G38]TCP90592.1 DNA-binding transcriptional LysR family regulator [Rhizobium sp. PP-CC-2G-626]TCQ27953.1 DNA-binding transcriptional LysR family regulator [Rhizobium sp. PP-CC-3G-465]